VTSILYVAKPGLVAPAPTIDVLTRKITAAFRQGKSTGRRWRGTHACSCGAQSDNTDYDLPGGQVTNSLAIHYMAYHREAVAPACLESVAALTDEADPTPEEMVAPTQFQGPCVECKKEVVLWGRSRRLTSSSLICDSCIDKLCCDAGAAR